VKLDHRFQCSHDYFRTKVMQNKMLVSYKLYYFEGLLFFAGLHFDLPRLKFMLLVYYFVKTVHFNC